MVVRLPTNRWSIGVKQLLLFNQSRKLFTSAQVNITVTNNKLIAILIANNLSLIGSSCRTMVALMPASVFTPEHSSSPSLFVQPTVSVAYSISQTQVTCTPTDFSPLVLPLIPQSPSPQVTSKTTTCPLPVPTYSDNNTSSSTSTSRSNNKSSTCSNNNTLSSTSTSCSNNTTSDSFVLLHI